MYYGTYIYIYTSPMDPWAINSLETLIALGWLPMDKVKVALPLLNYPPKKWRRSGGDGASRWLKTKEDYLHRYENPYETSMKTL